jgi:hypothetical protein
MEILSVTVSVFLTALVAYFVYQYRGLITYKHISLESKISIDNSKVVVSEHGCRLCFDQFEICNRGFTNVDNFELHDDIIYDLLGYKVISTTSVGKGTVSVEQLAKSLCISVRALPRGENVKLLLIFSGSNSFWDAKSGGSKYQIHPQAYFDGMSGAFSFFKTVLLISLLMFFVWKVKPNV